MNMALNNAKNVSEYYAAHGDTAVIELVVHGPGLEHDGGGREPRCRPDLVDVDGAR